MNITRAIVSAFAFEILGLRIQQLWCLPPVAVVLPPVLDNPPLALNQIREAGFVFRL